MRENVGRRRDAGRGLWWGYLPLVVVSGFFTAMVWMVPSDVPDGTTSDSGPATEVGEGQTASGWGTSVQPCADREMQVPDDGYSPPCFTFGGDNGGETARGVTTDTIRVAYRQTNDPPLIKILADYAGVPLDESGEELARTAEGLVDYFNQNFQLHGRRIELVGYTGNGSVIAELTGSGQDDAGNDALKVASDLNAFADVTALTQPYAEALSRQGVVNLGVPYMSREWFTERRPYAWSHFPDCTVSAEVSAEVSSKAILGRPARYAGGDLNDRPRSNAVIAPENQVWQQCVSTAVQGLGEGGFPVTLNEQYVLDVATVPDQASSILSKLRANDITSVTCACDPIMLMALAEQAQQAGYQPEWLIVGVGFIDLDLVGQMIQQNSGDQWSRAFGSSSWGRQQPLDDSEGYRAYRSVRDDEPSTLVDLLYYQLYELVIGIQMAGPELTPETFEAGMFAYPGGTGPIGTWDFGPEHYTGTTDARILWWDMEQPSPFNGQPGSYVDDGTRFTRGELPEGDLAVFG
jgi:hypothetical protein